MILKTLKAASVIKVVSDCGRGQMVVALCDKDGPFVAPACRSGRIYEFKEAHLARPEVTTA